MWILTNLHTGNKQYLLSEKKKYVVGRLGSDIVISDDLSISRSHAVFHITDETLRLEDLGSKYGTYCNENIETKNKLQKAKLFQLDEGGRILFGALKSEWQISKSNISTMVSLLSEAQLNEVTLLMNSLGGNIISTWKPICTHLTMSEITITIKVLHALIEKIPIVSCEYWKDYLKHIQEKKQPPAITLYLPKRSNKLSSAIDTNSFNFNDKRKTLFAGKTFVFMSKKHCDMYGPIVTKIGGECRDLKSDIHKSFLLKTNVIVIQYIPATQSQGSQTINTISEYLESNSLRTIPEYEIGLAIVCCNTEKYCNPSYNTISHILSDSGSKSLNMGTMLVENTRPEKSETNTFELPSTEIPDSDCLREKNTPYKIIQSDEMQSESVRNSYGCSESTKRIERVPQTLQKESFPTSGNKRKRLESYENEKKRKMEMLSISGKDVNNIEIVNQNTDKSKGKRNRTTEISEELQIAKKLHTSNTFDEDVCENYNEYVESSETASTNRNTNVKNNNEINALLASPNIRTTNSQSNTRFTGFLQISHCNSKKIKRQQINEAEPTKLGRIARITDDDSEKEDDIFNFGGPAKKLKTSGYNSDEELFGAKPSEDAGLSSQSNRTEESLPKTQPFISNSKLTSAKVTVSNIKITPLKFESEGWLSKLKMLNIKKEEDIKLDSENANLKQDEWIDSIRGGFEVRVRKMNLSVRGSHCPANRCLTNATITPSKKNFKTFVKIRNYKPQTVIVHTVPVVVPPMH